MNAPISLCVNQFSATVIARRSTAVLFALVVLFAVAVAPSPCAQAAFNEADNAIYKCTIAYDVLYKYDDSRHPEPGVSDVCARKRFTDHFYVILDESNSRYTIYHLDRRNKIFGARVECPLSCLEDFECRRNNRWEAIFGHFETANGTMDFDNDGDGDRSRSEQFCLTGKIRQNMRLREADIDTLDFITSARGWFQRMTCYDNTVYIESAIGEKDWSFSGPFNATDTSQSSGIACVRGRISWRLHRSLTDRWYAKVNMGSGGSIVRDYLLDRGWFDDGGLVCGTLEWRVIATGAAEPWLP